MQTIILSESLAYPEDSLYSVLRTIVDQYVTAKSQPAQGHPLMNWIRRLGTILAKIEPSLQGLIIKPEVGHSSNWSKNPYIQIRRTDLAPSRGAGLSMAYFFRADMSTVYLSLYIGEASLSKNSHSVELLRERISAPSRLSLTSIMLGPGTARIFEEGHVLGLEYDSSILPTDDVLRQDLNEMLSIYKSLNPVDVYLPTQVASESLSLLSAEAAKGEPISYFATPYSMEQLIEDTLWTREALEEILEALDPDDQISHQVILAGPPGTGKTFLARKLVQYATQGVSIRSRMVQFHPSYTYEHFIEGLKPVVGTGGALTFENVKGAVLRSADDARGKAERYYLIIDEINRANLPRVLGELMYLFEYREERVDLAYTRNFKLPGNLAFVGTMNTADRSIRSIDLALRRRFEIFECLADPVILEKFYFKSENECSIANLIDGFNALNSFLKSELDEYHTIGHTFFMRKRLTPDSFAQIWKRQILPTLGEYFFDRPEELATLTSERFWPSLE